jgi:hypothetical protein
MGNFTKPGLLFFAILSMFLMSFNSESIKTATPSDAFDYSVNTVSLSSLASSSATDFNAITNIISTETAASFNHGCKGKLEKLKKKYRRAIHTFSGIKQPVRQVELQLPSIYSKEIYTEPYFLSHLHRFLFRLTPF